MMTPPMLVPYPSMNFVAECKTMSAPHSMGRQRQGGGEGVVHHEGNLRIARGNPGAAGFATAPSWPELLFAYRMLKFHLLRVGTQYISPHLLIPGNAGFGVWWRFGLESSGLGEFPKNSINIDKFTGFFDKFPKIFEGKCVKLRGISGPNAGRCGRENRFRRPDSAAESGRRGILPWFAGLSMTANAGSCGVEEEEPAGYARSES